jgi:hypothetical protein
MQAIKKEVEKVWYRWVSLPPLISGKKRGQESELVRTPGGYQKG